MYNNYNCVTPCIPDCVNITGPTGPGFVSAYVNFEGFLILVKTDGTIVTTSYVIGPTGSTGVTGPTGGLGPTGAALTGPTGPSGESFSYVTIDECCNLILITDKGQTMKAGPISCCTDKLGITGSTGVTGERGYGISEAIIDSAGNLIIVTTDNRHLLAGNYKNLCPTGPQGPQGAPAYATNTGPTGPPGVSGYSMNTGPTGPMGLTPPHISMVDIDANGDVIVSLSDSSVINAGYVVGPTGPVGYDTNSGYTGATGFNYIAGIFDNHTPKTITIPQSTHGIQSSSSGIRKIIFPTYSVNNLIGFTNDTNLVTITVDYMGNTAMKIEQNMMITIQKAYSYTPNSNPNGTQLLTGVLNFDGISFPQLADNQTFVNPIDIFSFKVNANDIISIYPMTYSNTNSMELNSSNIYNGLVYAITNAIIY